MIAQNISNAIKTRKWLSIVYLNLEDKETKYWIAIKDLDIDNRTFVVDAFNVTKMNDEADGVIEINRLAFDKILSATIIDNTSYAQPDGLIEKINANIEKLDWLSYDLYNDDVLDYIHEAMKHEQVAYQSESTLIRGVDQEKLEALPLNGKYVLSLEQISDLVPKLERLSRQDEKKQYETTTLALNLLSIATNNGLFVIAYKELPFNPVEKS